MGRGRDYHVLLYRIPSHALPLREEIKALQKGIELGMKFIDTAEVYGHGRSETLVGPRTSFRVAPASFAMKAWYLTPLRLRFAVWMPTLISCLVFASIPFSDRCASD